MKKQTDGTVVLSGRMLMVAEDCKIARAKDTTNAHRLCWESFVSQKGNSCRSGTRCGAVRSSPCNDPHPMSL